MRASARLPLAVRSAASAARQPGTCDLAPEWNRYYTTMHPDDAADWEADICSAEAALSHAKQAAAHAEAVEMDPRSRRPDTRSRRRRGTSVR